jgi:allantoinase
VVIDGELRPATLVIDGGAIVAIEESTAGSGGTDLVVMPGLVDSHVHVNEPGRTEWEGFSTATRAAAAGGVTTIVDMPLNSIPATTTVDALEEKRATAEGQVHVDVAFWGGIVPGNRGELEAMRRRGVCGFKAFLVDSGVPEFPAVTIEELEASASVVGADSVVAVHAELPLEGEAAAETKRMGYADYLASRPDEDEIRAVAAVIDIARRIGTPMHIVHLSAAGALPLIAAARAAGIPISAETCPHYLALCVDDVSGGGTEFKCAPPIRDHLNREALWSGLGSGVLGLVVSDHSPAPPDLKDPAGGDFRAAWGGIASLELRLAVTWTGARDRHLGLGSLVPWLCRGPALLCGLADRGTIAPGAPADLVIWDPDAEFVVEPDRLRQRHPMTPYAGRRLRGMVRQTLLRGEVVYEDGSFGPPIGRLVRRP